MEFLFALWPPILLTAIVLFVASFICWTVLPHHESDFEKAPNEDELMDAIRKWNLPAGSYLFPFIKHSEMKDEALQEKYRVGPRGQVVLWDPPNMARNLGLTFLYFFLIALVTAYIAWTAFDGAGVGFMKAFQVTGAIGVLVFASSGQLNAVWFRRRTSMDFLDGIAYGILMGVIFGVLWPVA